MDVRKLPAASVTSLDFGIPQPIQLDTQLTTLLLAPTVRGFIYVRLEGS